MSGRNVSKKMRFEVLKRDNFTCQYCGAQAPEVVLHVDHVFPFIHGGACNMSNLKAACVDCNLGKRDVPIGFVVESRAETEHRAASEAIRRVTFENYHGGKRIGDLICQELGWDCLDYQHEAAIRACVYEYGAGLVEECVGSLLPIFAESCPEEFRQILNELTSEVASYLDRMVGNDMARS